MSSEGFWLIAPSRLQRGGGCLALSNQRKSTKWKKYAEDVVTKSCQSPGVGGPRVTNRVSIALGTRCRANIIPLSREGPRSAPSHCLGLRCRTTRPQPHVVSAYSSCYADDRGYFFQCALECRRDSGPVPILPLPLDLSPNPMLRSNTIHTRTT